MLPVITAPGELERWGRFLTEAGVRFVWALGTVGSSIGVTSSDANNPTPLVEIGRILLGRFKIFTVFLGIASLRKKINVVLISRKLRFLPMFIK